MLLYGIVCDRFDTFSARSNVSFELSIFLKMELIVIWDRSENKEKLESKQSTHVGHVHELTKALINWNSFTISPSPADVM